MIGGVSDGCCQSLAALVWGEKGAESAGSSVYGQELLLGNGRVVVEGWRVRDLEEGREGGREE